MSERNTNLPPEQEAIRAKCFHPPGTFVEFPIEDIETSIPARFEKIVQLYPDQLAVKTARHAITYAELNVMANRVAHVIVAERGNESEPVGLLLDKGVEQIAAMLGILKAGKFFILLEPSFPTERLSLVIEDSKPSLLLVDHRTQYVFQQDNSVRCKFLCMDSIAYSIPAGNLSLPLLPDALACIVYTSGSTGRPKGVIRDHRGLLHGALLRIHTDGISHKDRLAHITAGTANSVTNSFYALLQGAALVTFDLKQEGVARLANWLIDEKISTCLIASPVFRSLCTSLTDAERFPDLRYLRLRSDKVYSSDVQLHRKHFPATCSLASGLASTETGPLREFRITHDTEVSDAEVPVGYALKDKEILLLNEGGEQVGSNEVGEIVVRSEYLALGYWNDPELTAAKFKPDPQGTKKRMYYTGDLGQMLPDGCLIHKGRKDFRVKIRGYGVDLVEVERTLRSHRAIKDAVVIAKQRESGDARLIAYYTAESQPEVSTDELRKFLGANLADYMIPSAFVKLKALPLTSNGKVNRNALPEPGQERPELKDAYQLPRNATERALVKIWEDLLEIRPVGIHDNFFDLGGDSLTATRLVSEVVKNVGWELTLQKLFQRATVGELAAAIDQQRGPKSENDAPVRLPAVSTKSVSRDCLLPLSHAQQGLWFLDQLHPGSFTYNLFSAYRFKGNLDIAALEKGFNEIIRRHEILRTVFKLVDNSPVQVILQSLHIEIPVIDLQRIASEEERRTEVRRLSTQEAQRPFDLSHGPLLRITLFRLAQDDYVLLRAIHHAVFDAWSSGVLNRELAQLYEAFSKGEPSPLPDLSIQYANYALWQCRCFETGALQDQLAYWKTQLANLSPLPLPTDKPRPSINNYRGARRYYKLSRELSEGLRALTRRYGVTLFTTLLAAFQTLISRYSGQTDVVIGSAVAGRNHREFDQSIGQFLNMVALRTDLSGSPTFAEVTARVWTVCLEALSHQDLPFQRVVEELRPARDLSHDPLIQVAFAFVGTMNNPPRLPGIEVSELEVETGIAKFDLQLEIEDRGEFLGGFLDYNVDLFEADTILRMLEHFRIVLESVVINPDRPILEIPLLTKAERQKLLIEWNDSARDHAKDKCIQQMFEEQAERIPEAVAVAFKDQKLTYRELNNRANQLAHYLQRLGVGPDMLVGICMERSIEMVVGLLGILKAGGAYLPLDPEHPKERLEFMLANARVTVLLIQEGLREDAGSKTDDSDSRSTRPDLQIRRVCLDRDWELIARESESDPETITTTDNLAYVIYTSGSTGQPKGVQITHKSVLNLIFWHHQAFSVTPSDRATQLAGSGFDAAVWELWPYLTVGASIHVPDEMTRLDAASLRDWLVAQAITISFVPPVLAESLMALEWPRETTLRALLTGGDTLHIYPPETLPFPVFNNYGPTEYTVVATSAQVSPNSHPVHFPSIGRPIANTQVYILDRQLQPVPIGVAGELHIGGDGVARGYLNQPELTAEKFVYHSFNEEPARRLYKTGDLARYTPEGNIEFIGRVDNQVKVRGYRVELGEIETMLGQHPMVQSSVAVVREDTPGDKRLVAYVVGREKSFDGAEIRKYLKQRLPEYMVPSAFILLDALPLTPNGKIDRSALPAPDQGRPDLGSVYQAPRTPMEETLAAIWSEVLKLDRVGIRDNFFELGGHSLMATQIISRVRGCLSIELPLRTMFESSTVEQMAETIMEQREKLSGQAEQVCRIGVAAGRRTQRLGTEEASSRSVGDRHERTGH